MLNINIGFIIQIIKMNVGNLFSALIIHVVFASLLTDWIKTCYAVIRYNCHTFLVLGFRITCMMQRGQDRKSVFPAVLSFPLTSVTLRKAVSGDVRFPLRM